MMYLYILQARYENKEDTRRQLVATKVWSPNDYYIQLTTPTKSPTVGEYMIFNVKTNAFVEYILYHVSVLSVHTLSCKCIECTYSIM